jgi:hypothetical protein
MKTSRIAALIIAAVSFNATAQDADPTSRCMAGLTSDGRLAAIAQKVGLEYPREPNSPTLQHYASSEERAALAVWQGLRRQCFDAGAQQRRKMLDAQARGAMESAFVFQQVLLSRLQQGELTYGEFNRRRADVAESFELRI